LGGKLRLLVVLERSHDVLRSLAHPRRRHGVRIDDEGPRNPGLEMVREERYELGDRLLVAADDEELGSRRLQELLGCLCGVPVVAATQSLHPVAHAPLLETVPAREIVLPKPALAGSEG